MGFPLPSPDDLTRRQEALMEQAILAARPDASPAAVARAVRSPRGVLAAIVRDNAMALYEAHLHLSWWGQQYFPDTAEGEALDRHGNIWGVYRRAATAAMGKVIFAGEAGVEIAAGLEMQSVLGLTYQAAEGGVIPEEGTLTLAVVAVDAGKDGNLDAGSSLTLVTALSGLNSQAAMVDGDGLAGGADREGDADFTTRILDRIRNPGHGGSADDYRRWVKDAYAASFVRANPITGGVSVVVAMGTAAAPRVPTAEELADILAYLDELRPVGMADFFVTPVVLRAIDHRVVLSPDTSKTRANVTAAITSFYAREADIGGTIYRSRLSEAISAADGEYNHELFEPAGDTVCAENELPVPGDLVWSAP